MRWVGRTPQNDSSVDLGCDTAPVDTAAGTDLTPPVVEAVRSRVEGVLRAELRARRNELSALDPSAEVLVEEVERLLAAGGERLRPAFCYLGYRAAGGATGADRAPRPAWNCCTRSRSCTTT
jgi:geranylgeranyl diphosphate synthase type I